MVMRTFPAQAQKPPKMTMRAVQAYASLPPNHPSRLAAMGALSPMQSSMVQQQQQQQQQQPSVAPGPMGSASASAGLDTAAAAWPAAPSANLTSLHSNATSSHSAEIDARAWLETLDPRPQEDELLLVPTPATPGTVPTTPLDDEPSRPDEGAASNTSSTPTPDRLRPPPSLGETTTDPLLEGPAPPWGRSFEGCPESRRAPDGRMYTHAEFLAYFGEAAGSWEWNAARGTGLDGPLGQHGTISVSQMHGPPPGHQPSSPGAPTDAPLSSTQATRTTAQHNMAQHPSGSAAPVAGAALPTVTSPVRAAAAVQAHAGGYATAAIPRTTQQLEALQLQVEALTRACSSLAASQGAAAQGTGGGTLRGTDGGFSAGGGALESTTGASTQPSDIDLCVICMDAPRSHLLAPCGHRAVCGVCAHFFGEGQAAAALCPMCRAPVQQVIRVYD